MISFKQVIFLHFFSHLFSYFREASDELENIRQGDLAIIVGPDDPENSDESKEGMTYTERKWSWYRKIQIGLLSSSTQHKFNDNEYLFYNTNNKTQAYRRRVLDKY